MSSASTLYAQSSFKVAGREVQVHGSIQQGFVVSDGNNFLTMDTTDGSTAMTDGAVNVSSQVNSKLRAGAQLYSRNIGELGNGHVQFDWAFADYRFHDAIGVRGGKVKTLLGLFNDTQDLEFLHTWALLPQGVYPLDLRSVTIAHIGADVYGALKTKKAGTLNYTVYAGAVPDDKRGGYRYGVEDAGLAFTKPFETFARGLDLRWNTPLEGLTAGYSLMSSTGEGDVSLSAAGGLPVTVRLEPWRQQSVYGDYQWENLRLSGEFRHQQIGVELEPAIAPPDATPSRSWFASGSYRVTKHIELGTYYSNFVADSGLPTDADTNHISDRAVTARVDLNRFWSVKVEGHFMDGYGDPFSARGFYLRSNPEGLDSRTNMLVVRTGITF